MSSMPSNTFIHTYTGLSLTFGIGFGFGLPTASASAHPLIRELCVAAVCAARARYVPVTEFKIFFLRVLLQISRYGSRFLLPLNFPVNFLGTVRRQSDRRALRSFGHCRAFGPGGRSKAAVRIPAVGVGLACAHWAASPVANFSEIFLRGCVPFAEFAKFLRGLCLFDSLFGGSAVLTPFY